MPKTPVRRHRTSRGTKIVIALSSVVFLLLLGTVVYHFFDGFTWLDSFYFTSMTITTIGYGDHVPTTPFTKLFTVFIAFAGVGLVFYSVTMMATEYVERRAPPRI